MQLVGLPIGVSVLCPGWVHTALLDADRNWPGERGEPPSPGAAAAAIWRHYQRAVEEGLSPADVAGPVADAVHHDRYWVFPQQEWLDLLVRRTHMIAEQRTPTPADQIPGMPPRSQIVAEVRAALGISAETKEMPVT
jgi:hypothetical protein